MFSKIAEIESIREYKAQLSKREAELTKPMLTDLNLIFTIYEWFKELLGDKCVKVYQRKKFIFIILFLYCPESLAGGRIKKGLREKIGEVIGMKSKSIISNNLNGIVFSYRLYKYFKQDIDSLYAEIAKRLHAERLIE